ncbi:VOC family protein [Nocardioides sp.]|uniref:VOC family protein n=1 Tax=Nocardioides sp. TaxID=35761 RepID=UPI002724344D|nr:VOC family protein [Nocardioides sp.]MDO9458364.1 VOC family protein [Nocardioides sp.]
MTTTPFWVSAFLDFTESSFERGVVFWAEVTGSRVSPRRGDEGEFATLVPPDGDDHLRVQRLRTGHSGLHLDLHVPDPRAAADRAVGLGATEVADWGYVVMSSPAGLTFCFVGHRASRRSSPVAWPGGRSAVDQVCLDIGPAAYDAELDFWRAVTDFSPTPTSSPEFRRLDGPGPLRFLLQRLDDEQAPRFHLDLSADDRAAEVARHRALGATHVAEGRGWTVLADPGGTRYCVTDREPAPAAS